MRRSAAEVKDEVEEAEPDAEAGEVAEQPEDDLGFDRSRRQSETQAYGWISVPFQCLFIDFRTYTALCDRQAMN